MKNFKSKNLKISILGAGSWGGTLAWLLGKKYKDITIWTPSQAELDFLNKKRKLIRPKNLKLSRNIKVTKNLKLIVENSDLIIIAVPTNAFKSTVIKLKKQRINKSTVLLSATKGITTKESLRPSVILKKYFPKNPIAVLSGPNIALDVISEAPIISVVASRDARVRNLLQDVLSARNFRIYQNKDVDGIEIAGALKNVIAIAAGMSDGFGFNISTKAALISRGLVEIAKIAKHEGANPKTLLGAAGIGDLIATCCSINSRNYKVGYKLAKGQKLKRILEDLGQVAEGAETVKAMKILAKKYKVNVPITDAVYDIAINGKRPKTVLRKLLSRPLPKYEIEF